MKNEKEVRAQIKAIVKERDALLKERHQVAAATVKAIRGHEAAQDKFNAKNDKAVTKLNAKIDKLAAKLPPELEESSK